MHNPITLKRVLSAAIALSLAATLSAQKQAETTKAPSGTLVVGIVIDQLRSDYIEQLQPQFAPDGGFNRLMSQGAYFQNVDFGCRGLDIASGTALLMTGAYPNVNGINCQEVYSHEKRRTQPILNDEECAGVFTNEKLSPKVLKVSTLADEVRVNNDGLGHVHAIAPDPQQAIIMAGHAANSAFWINDVDGRWSTSNFYKDQPYPLRAGNNLATLSQKLSQSEWIPLLPLDQYVGIPHARRFYRFRYIFPQAAKDRYTSFKKSALVNEEITSMAIECISHLSLGRRGQMDMLNLGYTAAAYPFSKDADNRFELHDTYLRLDQQLGRLFNAIDSLVGAENKVVFVASTGYFTDPRPVDPKYGIPTGEFFPERGVSLLNMFLMATYGNAQWVDGYYNKQFFLNHKQIEQSKLSLAEVRAKSSEFVRQMSGITAAYTYEEILNNPVNDALKALNRMMLPEYQGDVTIEVAPGWSIVENINAATVTTHVRAEALSTPAFILAPQVKAERYPEPIQATFLAPTLSRILSVRSPNAAFVMPLSLSSK